jgi:predicted anti-sigma-YlaC factor YlaD
MNPYRNRCPAADIVDLAEERDLEPWRIAHVMEHLSHCVACRDAADQRSAARHQQRLDELAHRRDPTFLVQRRLIQRRTVQHSAEVSTSIDAVSMLSRLPLTGVLSKANR